MRRHPQAVARPSTARRMARVLALTVFVLALGLLAVPGANADSATYVRLAQLSPDMSGVTISVASVGDPSRDIVLPVEPYGALSAYQRIEPGDYVVTIRGAGNTTTPVVSSALKADAGTSYTLASVGAADKRALAVFTDDLTAPPAGRARVRLINAAPPAPVLDVRGPDGARSRPVCPWPRSAATARSTRAPCPSPRVRPAAWAPTWRCRSGPTR